MSSDPRQEACEAIAAGKYARRRVSAALAELAART